MLNSRWSHALQHRPIRVWRARPGAGQILPLPLTVPSLGWIQVIEGQLALGGQQSDAASVLITPEAAIPRPGLPTILGQGDGLGFAAGDLQAVEAIDRPADLLLFQLA
jgi:redox-sensitive bicupin YhaK (pirin superfamily)